MIVPILQLSELEPAFDAPCSWAKLQIEVGDGEISTELVQAVEFERYGELLQSSEIAAFLSLDLALLEDESFVLSVAVDIDESTHFATISGTLINGT